MSKTDAEIYADVGKRRWPYVDEPTNKGHQRKRRLDGEGTAVVNRPTPKPLAPAGAEATKDDHSR